MRMAWCEIEAIVNEMKLTTFPFLFILLFVIGTGAVLAQQDYSNTHISNASGQPLGVIDLRNHNKKVATIYITGKEATFGPNQILIKGSG